jgi:peptidoglycan/LPS O-acetylase OafA/YrhL
MKSTAYQLGYRGDIEGLRAIAILLVVAAHAKVTWLTGGFIGVDVFFVLSGYLITGVLLREIEQTGQLRFARFYARRFRRLLPALLTVIAVTSVAALILLPPGEQGTQAIAAATAAIWSSNLHFAFAQLDYFSTGAAGNLFLHTWSLGVEEQFYLVWPALLVGALALGKTGDAAKRAARLKAAMLIIGAASLVACLVTTGSAPQMAFYLMPLRAWQFATGALVWLYAAPAQTVTPSGRTRLQLIAYRWCGWFGLCLILLAGWWFDAGSAYPGWRALLPTLGSAAVILAGSHDISQASSRLLCWRPLQAIGHISYSWYLWHWPVLLLGNALTSTQQGVASQASLVALSLVLAALSYRWVESPVRHQARWLARPGVTVMGALAIMIAANVLCIVWFNSAAKWLQSPTQQRYAQARVDAPIIYAVGCDDWYHSATLNPCWFGSRNAKHTAVLMGDSVDAQWFPAVATALDNPDWRLLVLTKSSCPMVDESIFYARIGRDFTECDTWRRRALDAVASLHPDIVILGSVETYAFTREQWTKGTTRVLSAISNASGHVYLLRATPQLPFNGPSCLSARHWPTWLHIRKDACQTPNSSRHADEVYQWLTQASSGFANVSMLDMNDLVCPAGVCYAERNGLVVFRDAQHLTATFAESLGAAFGKRLAPQPGTLFAPETHQGRSSSSIAPDKALRLPR